MAITSDPGTLRGSIGSSLGRIFAQRIVDAVLMIVADVITNQPAEVTFIEDDHLVQQFPAAAANP